MSRYVNADVICLAADELTEETDNPTSLAVFQGVKNLVNRMNDIDIVKCIDCKRCSERGGHANCNGYLICTELNRVVDEDTYCAWGERK